MTPAGKQLTLKYYDRMAKKYGHDWFKKLQKPTNETKTEFSIDRRPLLKVKDFVESILKDIKQLLYELGFEKVNITYISHETEALARYIGLSNTNVPTIAISTRSLSRWSKKQDINLSRYVETTMVHEFGHAYLELEGGYISSVQYYQGRIFEPPVIKFAEIFAETRDIKKSKKILDDFIEKHQYEHGV